MKQLLFILIMLGATAQFKSQSYEYIANHFPTIPTIDSIDKAFILSIDTSKLEPLKGIGVRIVDIEGKPIEKYKIEKNHILGKFHRYDYCWSFIVTNYHDRGAVRTTIIQLMVHDTTGNLICAYQVAKYLDLGPVGKIIERCYFFDLGFEIRPYATNIKYTAIMDTKKRFEIINNKLFENIDNKLIQKR